MNNGPTTIRRSISWIGTPWEEMRGQWNAKSISGVWPYTAGPSPWDILCFGRCSSRSVWLANQPGLLENVVRENDCCGTVARI